ncbi:hypothetical protein BGZ76_005893 [Entomortierella beljakovae]|nr:hypothetical protein BGZ76_005893 [Entomortierella beljakovae]
MESLVNKENTERHGERQPLPFRAPAEGSAGSENDANISRMINDGCSWANIKEAIGEGVFERYKDVLDPDLPSLWSSDAIIKLNGIVQSFNGQSENMEAVLCDISNLDEDDLPWDKIAEEMGFPSPGGCKYVWSSFGNGRHLSSSNNQGKIKEKNVSKSIETLGLGLGSSIGEDQARGSIESQGSRLKEEIPPNTSLQDFINTTQAFKHTESGLGIDDTKTVRPVEQVYDETRQSPSPSQAQLEKLNDIQRVIENIDKARLLEREQRHIELERFLEGVESCKRRTNVLPSSSPQVPLVMRPNQVHHTIEQLSSESDPELGKRRREIYDQDDPSISKIPFLINSSDTIISPEHMERLLNENSRERGESSSIAQTMAFASQQFVKRHRPNNSLDREEDLEQTSIPIEHPIPHQAQQSNLITDTCEATPRHEKQTWTAEDAIVLWKSRQEVGDNWEYISNEALHGKHSPNACRIYVHGS